ncbi:MAG: hypothetical protein AAF404_07670, partial [Pseudomonadota bacterium]
MYDDCAIILPESRSIRLRMLGLLVCLLPAFWLMQTLSAVADIENTARALATYDGSSVTSVPSSVSVPVIPANPRLAVNKTGVLNDDDGTPGLSAGDTISYTIEVTNPGNITLTGIIVTDPLITVTFVGGDTDNDFRLDVTETWTYTGSYTITSSDIASNGGGDGDIDNIAIAQSNESIPAGGAAETSINPTVALVVAKTGVMNDDDGTPGLSAGDTISYTITAQNAGGVDLTNIVASDLIDQSGATTALPLIYLNGDLNSDGVINVGETWTHNATHTLTQANIDDGGDLVNTATVTSDESGPRTGTDTQVLSGFIHSYTMTKIGTLVDSDTDSLADAGEDINYTFRFTNTGNSTLTNLLPDDPLPGLSAIVCANDGDGDGDIDTLAPAQTLDCTASYTVTSSDVLGSSVDNTATATAAAFDGVTWITEDDSANDNTVSIPTDLPYQLGVEKTIVSVNQLFPTLVEIEYLIKITNETNALQTGIVADDDLVAAIVSPAQLDGDASIVSFTGFSGTGSSNV